MTDLESEKQIVTVVRNLSLFGCFVATATPLVTGTKVRLRITYQGVTFAAFLFSAEQTKRYTATASLVSAAKFVLWKSAVKIWLRLKPMLPRR